MKLFKKTLAMFLSTVMLAGLIAVPATQAAAAGETVTRTINLLDLSKTAAGTTLSKENLTNWPKGMTVGDFDDYDGTRSVVELEDGTKALKLAFNVKQNSEPTDRKLSTIANYDFKFSIPAAYRPYLNNVKLKLENNSNPFNNWALTSPYFLLAFTNGTDYSKISDKTLNIEKAELEYTLPVAGVAKVSAWLYQDYADINSGTKWTEEEKSGMTDVVLSVTVPYIDDLTTYMLIKSLELEITGTKEDLDAAEKAANAITRTINLLDLSETAAGTTLSKENLTNWPKGMSVGDFDDYDGTRSVVELSDGTKALKLAFNVKQNSEPTDRKLSTIANYDFKFSIPAAYRPYLNNVKLKLENNSNPFNNWALTSPYFLLAFTNGTDYSKISDKTLNIEKAELEYTLPVAGVAKVSAWLYQDYADINSGTKWTEEEKSGMTDVVLSVTVPYIDDLTTYMLIKSLELEITGTKEELDAAEKEALSASTLINNFESGAGSNVVNAKDKGVFAASGDFVLEHTRTSDKPWDNDISVSLDSRVRFYDGISFYLYNPNEAKELKCYLWSASGAVAQKNFAASKAGDYIKYTVWFDDVGTTNGNWDSDTTNTGVSLTPTQIASLSSIQFRVPDGGSGVSYYFDDFRYEKRNSEPVKEKKLDLKTAVITEDNGYTDTEQPKKTADSITYSVDGKVNLNDKGEYYYQGWKTVIDVSDGTMINANGLNITATYKSTGTNKLKIGATLYGIDENGKEQWWNWGENPDSINVSAGEKVTSTLRYTEGLYETGEWGIHNWGNKKGYPTGSESAMLKEIQLYVWAPADAVADDTVTISEVSVLYGGGKVSLADGVMNGTISVGDNGYTYRGSSDVSNTGYFFAGEKAVINIIPDTGYALVPGSLKLIDSTGKEIEITREGFRKLSSASYSFTMPAADVTVLAEFASEADVLGKVYGSVSTDIANNQLKFDYTVPLKKGNVAVNGTEYRAVGYGVLVTTYEVLEKYSFWDGFTVEDIENGNYIAELSTNVHINESDGYFYDKSASAVRFNAVVNVPDSMKDTVFAAHPYVEYEKDGKTERLYGNNESYSFASQAFGMDNFAAEPSYAKGVNMAGVFDNTNADATAVRNSIYVASETYNAVKTAGFDHVRLPVTFASHLDADGTINAEYLEAVDKAVIAALSNDLTVVIDLHHYGELKDNVSANEATFYSIWEQLAKHYKNYPNRVIFELLNEPNTTGSATSMNSEALNRIQLEVVGKIRAIDNDRKRALAVFNNNSAYSLQYLSLPADKSNLIISIHNYDAYGFTHQDLDSNCPVGVDYAASGSADQIKTLVNTVRAYSNDKGIPVWISEFGVYLGGLNKTAEFKDEDVTSYYSDFTKACGTDIGWCVWEYNVGFGVFDSNNNLKDFVKNGLFQTN